MSLIDVRCDLQYEVLAPTSFLFNVAALRTPGQAIESETVVLDPNVTYTESAIGDEGNRIFRLTADPGPFRLRYNARARLAEPAGLDGRMDELAHAELPDDVLSYLTPSRYCESDRLGQLAEDEFGAVEPGYQRVAAICDWIGERMEYTPGSTDSRTTACDVLLQRTGVCRDYAHLAITLCRALCIPARYVSAYALNLEPADFHGYFEAYLGANWYPFDPTGMAPLTGLVQIGVGRDAADTSFATIIGSATLESLTVEAIAAEVAAP